MQISLSLALSIMYTYIRTHCPQAKHVLGTSTSTPPLAEGEESEVQPDTAEPEAAAASNSTPNAPTMPGMSVRRGPAFAIALDGPSTTATFQFNINGMQLFSYFLLYHKLSANSEHFNHFSPLLT